MRPAAHPMRPWRARLLAVLVLVATVTTSQNWMAPHDVSATTVETDRPTAGIAMGGPWTWTPPPEQARDLDRIASLGVDWIRVSFPWSAMEPTPGRYDWRAHDTIVRLAHERGLKVIANVAYTPAWARAPLCVSNRCAPARPESFASFIGRAVERYATYGVDAWEVWNEPNLSQFWRPAPDPVAYTQLLRLSYRAAKLADPDVTVLGGALAPAPRDTELARNPLSFLSAMYEAGAGGSFDALSVHPYSYPRAPLHPSPTNSFYHLPLAHELMAQHGDGHKQVWITEFGYWTSWSATLRPAGSVTPQQQAAYLREAYEATTAWPWVGPFLWYSYRDLAEGSLDREDNFGLVRHDGTAKPGLSLLRVLLAGG